MNNRLLIIDDDPEIQNAYRMILSPEDADESTSGAQLARLLGNEPRSEPKEVPRFELSFAGQGPEGVALAEAAQETNQPFAAAFIDIRMPPGFDGMETAARIRRIDPDIEMVMVTAYSDRSREEIVRAVGAPEKLLFLRKPFDPEELIQMALSLTAKWNLARKAEERKNDLETVLMTTPAAIFTVNRDKHITSWNPAAEQITGYAASQVLDRPCILMRIGNEDACGGCLLEAGKTSDQYHEIEIVDSKGAGRTLLKKGTCIKDHRGNIIRMVESFWDITARKAAEAALAHSEERFRALVETTSDWVWETDAAGRFSYCSPLCESIYGYSSQELIGSPIFDMLMHPEEIAGARSLFSQCLQEKRGFHNIEHRRCTKEGSVIHIETSGIPVFNGGGSVVGFRGIDRDITNRIIIEKERRELEAQYRQSQKLESLGTLAGGIAHDLNNVLTPIMGGAQLSLMALDSRHPIYDYLKTIEEGVQRAADLIHQILAFSRKQVMSVKPLNLTHLIKNVADMLRRLIREDIQLTFKLEEALDTIDADKNQMEQILINLVVNARDAVTQEGEIVIQTANQAISGRDGGKERRQLAHGTYVVMSVKDNGTGMDPLTLGRIFDPFYTTKDAGQGTGLGLSTVYGIVKQHGGDIRVESTSGKGTCFDIYFKTTPNSVKDDAPTERKTVSGGKEAILLVEDNIYVRDVTHNSLSYYGYRVIEAANGVEALQIFKDLEGRIDLLLTDVVMPDMGGQPLAAALREHKPDLPVIFMSGHPFDVNTKRLAELAGNDFIQKPFKPLDVAQKVRRMLDRTRKEET